MRLSMNKQDICESVEIPKEDWEKTLSEFIKATVNGEKHLGDNLKRQCIKYLERLEQENQDLKRKHFIIQGGRGSCKTYLMHLEKENKQLKEVIEEIREFVGSEEMYNCSFEEETNKLLQILDKVKEVK